MSEEHPDYGDQTKQNNIVVGAATPIVGGGSPERVFLPRGSEVVAYQPTYARLEALERKVAELERIVNGLQNVGTTTQASHPEA